MTDTKYKPPIWAYADEWAMMPESERAVRITYICGIWSGTNGTKLPSYELPARLGDIIQYGRDGSFQHGWVINLRPGECQVQRYGSGRVTGRAIWVKQADVVAVVSRRDVERPRHV
jgi:hypothetical protein